MIYLFLANGFEEVEALCPLDLLRRAGLEVTTVGVGGGEEIVGSHGIHVRADMPEEFYRDTAPDMVILPGGMPGTLNLDSSKTVHAAIRAAQNHGGILAAICAAPMILGEIGLLQGKKATCFPGMEEHLKGAVLSGEKVVIDGKTVTSRGMGTALDFGLALVALQKGEAFAADLKKKVQA